MHNSLEMMRRMNIKVIMDNNPLAPSNAAPVDFHKSYRARPAWVVPQTMALPRSGRIPAAV
jgi:hypothetical protein